LIKIKNNSPVFNVQFCPGSRCTLCDWITFNVLFKNRDKSYCKRCALEISELFAEKKEREKERIEFEKT